MILLEGLIMYQAGHVFPFISYISGFKVHFNETEPCVVLAKIGTATLHASGPSEYPRTSCQ